MNRFFQMIQKNLSSTPFNLQTYLDTRQEVLENHIRHQHTIHDKEELESISLESSENTDNEEDSERDVVKSDEQVYLENMLENVKRLEEKNKRN